MTLSESENMRNFMEIPLKKDRFIQFQLTVNIVAVTVAFVGAVSGGESPLQPVQMLWVNLIMDTLAALALATERPTPELFNRPPHGRHSPLITWKMWRHIGGHAIAQLCIMAWLYYGGWRIGFLNYNEPEQSNFVAAGPVGTDQFQFLENAYEVRRSTVVFNTFVFLQLFNELNARMLGDELNMLKGITSSYLFIAIFFITAAVQVIIVEFGGDFSKTTSLNAQTWGLCIGVGFISIPVGFLLRFVPTPADKTHGPPPELAADESELTLIETSEAEKRPRKSSRARRTDEIEDAMVNNYFAPPKRRTAVGNWAFAKRVLWQVQVIKAFRKPLPRLISGSHV